MKNLFVFRLANSLSETCDSCNIKTTCDSVDYSIGTDEDSDEILGSIFGLKMPCGGLEFVVYTPIIQLKGKRF